ncbi:UxaA family hydrolase [Pontibacter beigongshangensis]|uniref:UxaA family hydrolase n=1 Tax=Pontibacter beigongshangensis TaxID=2574733 RepID=UPI0019D51839|nr:UxaA family hydrolase [Pontibacter beigongshangensis]
MAVALQPLVRGAACQLAEGHPPVVVLNDIPFTHKVALTAIGRGEPIIKYGSPIGSALVDIQAGEHVHVHNIGSNY